ncbi:unnamed protein product [Trichogramma brassicae]|uniref:Uncharacterized protein n=1 Tax=Trichogramma brassicae TaxID=86971 RepID=A0A6H5ILY5_9HYME|nr:unnamed protein product [Trichogramma brassicae]
MIDEALAGGGFRSAFAQSMHEEMGNSAPVELQMPSPAPSTPEGTLQFLRKRRIIRRKLLQMTAATSTRDSAEREGQPEQRTRPGPPPPTRTTRIGVQDAERAFASLSSCRPWAWCKPTHEHTHEREQFLNHRVFVKNARLDNGTRHLVVKAQSDIILLRS